MSAANSKSFSSYGLPLLMLLAAALYLPSLKNGYVGWDDALITANPNIRSFSPENLRRIFIPALDSPASYQPLRTLAHALVYAVSGTRPFGYLLLNILLYLATIFLFYRLVEYLLASGREAAGELEARLAALAAAAFFAFHPVHVEAVSWLQGGKQSLMAVFFLLSFIHYLKYSREGRRSAYWISLIAFLAALTAQPGALGLPLLILGYEALSAGWSRGSIRATLVRISLRTFPFLLPGILLVLFLLFFTTVEAGIPAASLPARLSAIPLLWTKSLLKLLVPVNICCRYPLTAAVPPQYINGGILALVLAGSGWALLRAAGNGPAARLAVLWFCVTLVPTSGLVRTSTLMADRYLFLPSLGFALLAGLVYCRIGRPIAGGPGEPPRQGRLLAAVLALVLAASFALITLQRQGDWREARTLWSRVVEVYPRDRLGTLNLAEAFYRQGSYDEALKLYRKAIDIDPSYGDSWLNLGQMLCRKGDFREARKLLVHGLRLRPDREEGWINLGICLSNTGEDSAAFLAFQRVIDLNREMVWSAHYNRAMLYLREGDTLRAVIGLERAARSDPAHLTAEVWVNIGRSLERLGRSGLALELLMLGREETAFDAECWRTLGNLQALSGNAGEGVESFERAAGLAPGDYRNYVMLGFAGQQSGDEALAARAYRKALGLGAAERPEILNNLGQALAGQDSLASAESAFLEALRENAEYLDARVNLGLLYRRIGDRLKAKDQLELALRLCREQPSLSGVARHIESLLADLNAN